MRTAFQEWTDYRENIVPAGASDVQVEECRRAFYAGAWAIYWLILESTEPGPDEEAEDFPDDQAERNLEALRDELFAILKDLRLETHIRRDT